MLLKLGSKSPEVAEVQKLLSMMGYDLIIDGEYGPKTVRSINAFQKKSGLVIDGEVGDKTYQALKAAQKNTSKEMKGPISPTAYNGDIKIINDKQLAPTQYIKQIFKKTQLFIHFTAGAPSAANVIHGWDSDEPQIAVSYVIDGDTAEIYEAYNPNFWSFHLGIKGTNGKLDRVSVGIEICAWGPITEKNGKFYTYTNKEVPANKICTLDEPFRGYKYFYAYSDAQLASLETLLLYLIKTYDISVQDVFDKTWFDYKQDVIDNTTPGIWTHVNVRKDKTDSYPDQRLLDLLNKVSKQVNSK